MDTDGFSDAAYDIIVQAAQVSDTLKAQLGVLSQIYNNEDDWLHGIQTYLQKIEEEPDDYVEFWGIKEFEYVTTGTIMALSAKLRNQVDSLILSRKGHKKNFTKV